MLGSSDIPLKSESLQALFLAAAELCLKSSRLPAGCLQPERRSHVFCNRPALHLRPRREKLFGAARGIPLDRNAKARIIAYAQGYNARMKQPGQHRGPITRAFMEVLEALLWGFHNSKTGLCFPSYESIAEKAKCSRDTVYEAIKALEAADVLTWVNRIVRIRHASSTCSANGRPAGASFAPAMPTCFAIPCPVPKADR